MSSINCKLDSRNKSDFHSFLLKPKGENYRLQSTFREWEKPAIEKLLGARDMHLPVLCPNIFSKPKTGIKILSYSWQSDRPHF